MEKTYTDIHHTASFGGKKRLVKHYDKQKVEKWLPTQLSYSLHKPLRKKFPTRKYKVSGIDEIWQMDLLEMIPYAKINKGYRYILVCIDTFSRFVRALPCKTKTGEEITTLTLKMFKDKRPKYVQTDRGKEFYNKEMKQRVFEKYGIKHYTVNSQFKAPIVERFNRTLREKLNRYFTHTGKKVWYTILPSIITTYNKTKHRGILYRKPIEITKINQSLLWWELHNQNTKYPNEKPLNLLDYVRISQISVEHHFNKNFDQNWSEEVFRIVGIDTKAKPTMYIIEDLTHNVIEGKFYKAELQSIGGIKPQIYRIEKIVQTKGKGVNKQLLVKWHGYSAEHNTWILASSINRGDP